ncbi:PadR family transcriptional regulator [Salipaludibacillus sp. HK11]|uniref:PadR family transcriptional regulator n=1 Tax=Salipaludibacillus sp. HK11 TaxID=3394320 RepID=UPI0039FC84C4
MAKDNRSLYALLGFLTLGPNSGYDIKKTIEESIGYFWNENYGQIYPNFKLLYEQGLVTMELEEQDGKPDRKVYSITEDGKDKLVAWLSEPVDYPQNERKNELLLKLFFGRSVAVDTNIAHLKTYKNRMQSLLEIYQEVEKNIHSKYEDEPNKTYWLITLSNGKHWARSMIDWSNESIVTLTNEMEQD